MGDGGRPGAGCHYFFAKQAASTHFTVVGKTTRQRGGGLGGGVGGLARLGGLAGGAGVGGGVEAKEG